MICFFLKVASLSQTERPCSFSSTGLDLYMLSVNEMHALLTRTSL
jgi:hypothetical protein